jgi:serine/threonine protein kinase
VAVSHIHSKGVVHRDIKDENIILDRDTGDIKLIDFGCGTLLKESAYRDFSGTPEFYPPEWFTSKYYHARYSTNLHAQLVERKPDEPKSIIHKNKIITANSELPQSGLSEFFCTTCSSAKFHSSRRRKSSKTSFTSR